MEGSDQDCERELDNLAECEALWREKFHAATKVLRTIPSGTADAYLSDEQRQAWHDYYQALAWIRATS
jgi:hypothetical protein